MSSQVISKTACPQCKAMGGDWDNDNLVEYADGGKHCFACGYHKGSDIMNTDKGEIPTDFLVGSYSAVPMRGISEQVCRHFDYELGERTGRKGGLVHIANYYNGNELVGQKIREEGKVFYTVGQTTSLFGQNLYAPNKELFCTVTEGEIDALSVAQVQGVRFPVVSIPNGAQGAVNAFKRHLEYLKGFKHLVLAFDMDEPGQKAAQECAKLFEPGYCKIARLPCKDVNDMLTSGKANELSSCLFNAQAPKPNNIIKLSEIDSQEITEAIQPGVKICYPRLNFMLNGLRKQSLYTLVARAKAGKTTLTKEIALSLINEGHKVGILYLEEDAVSEGLSFVAMEMGMPQWQFTDKLLQDQSFMRTVQERLKTFEDRGLYLYNHKGVIDIESVHSTVNYMVRALGCDIIVLDNISISIAGTDVALNERKMIDKVVYDLVKLINNTKCTILTVVHVNQKGEAEEQLTRKDVFGSGAFLKFSRGLIALEKTGDGLVQLSVLGNRAKGLEGKADLLRYDQSTGRLVIMEEIL